MIDIRHLGAALDYIEKDFDAAALVRTRSPGSQALAKGVRFRADGGQQRGGGVRIMKLSSLGADSNSGLQVLWADGERVFCRGESHTDGDGAGVLAVRPAAEYPAPATLDRLAHEYGLKDELDDAWAARPLQLVREHGQTILMLKDPGGEPLDRLIGPPMEVGKFLRLAVALSAALGRLHGRGLIHNDIKPAHVLVNVSTSQVWLTGFGITSRLSRERQSPDPPEFLEGTLAYMAPEQTGRMNSSIDSRSDLYSLGITLYQLLTGTLPFTASDPMEWVHCHIAKNPMPPSQRLKNVPAPVSAIIMKLLAKAPEERYQTAAGLECDLRRCLSDAQGQIDPFPLGERDIPDRLLIPEKLYGRAREIDILLSSFDRIIKSGSPELVLVSGYSGIGKSSVVNELHRVLVQPRGLFASGKFDQFKRDIPYSTLAQACQSLIRPLLGTSDPELAGWREAFREALGPNGQLIVDLVPELKLIVGDQPPVPELPPHDAQRRFQLVFRRFLAVFARSEHPLALFLDDLQWLDSATLDLLEDLLTQPDVQHLMLIGAYRDNEVNSAHPLVRKLEAIRKAGAVVHEFVLAPLAREDLGRLIGDALHCEPERVAALAELIHEKTAGNPFFANQLIFVLVDEGLLTFDYGEGRWSWDLNSIRAKGYTDNVAELMAAKLSRLPPTTQKVLGQLACLGHAAESETLALVHEASDEATNAALWEAVRAGLVLRSGGTYAFLHDRVQEAAYALIVEDERAMAHLRIGRLVAARTPPEHLEENIFDIVNQFDRGATLISTEREREQVATFNLMAGKRAKAATAYAAALRYFVVGRLLLGENGWEQCYQLTFDLELNRGECEYLTGELAAAEERLSQLSTRARTIVHAAAGTCVRINLYTTLDRSNRAVEVGLEYLRRVDARWPEHATAQDVQQEYDRLRQRLGSGSIEGLLDLPLMTDPDRRATMDVLTVLTSPALFTDLNLFRLVVGRMASLSLEYGNSDGSSLAYAWLGGVLGTHFGDYQAGLRFGKLGLDLVEKRGLDRFRARVYLVFAVHVAHWTQPLATSRAFLRRAFEAAQEAGDLSYAAYSCIDLTANLFASGAPLDQVEREAEIGIKFAQDVGFGLAENNLIVQFRLVRMLRGLTLDFGSFNDATFDESRFVQRFENNRELSICACWYWIRKLQAGVYVSDSVAAIAATTKVTPLLGTTPTQIEQSEYQFYGALAQAARCDEAPAEERSQHLAALADHNRQIAVWAENCPQNFEHRAALVGAEIARIEGRELDAEHLYEQAIASARANGFIHNEALAYELAARFYAVRGFRQIADLYLRNARYGYLRWGAVGKVRQLDETYPDLRQEDSLPGPKSTIGAPVEHLDLATVIKVSQAVSSEIVLENLIDTLMRTAMAQAGAERALLIVPCGQEHRIEAEATTSGDTVAVRLVDEAVTGNVLPESVLHYVLRTRESVILDDAATQSPFGVDPYIRQRQARSILCLPLLNQAKLIGVLYLENNLTPRVFAPTRISVLKLLASQAAIALENAHLYRDVAEREAKIRRLVDSNIIGIFFWDFDGRVLEANDEFLRMVNYDREDLVAGRIRWADLTPPDWRDRNNARIEQQKSSGRFEPFEKEFTRKDGSRVPILIGGATFEEGGNQGVAFVLDLTERKRAEEALRESEYKLRQIIETVPGLLWSTDPDGELNHVNQRFLDYSGMQFEDFKHGGWEALQRPDDYAEIARTFYHAIQTGTSYQDVMRLRRADGEFRWYHVRGEPLRDRQGRIIQWYGLSVDIDERKRAEERLRVQHTVAQILAEAATIEEAAPRMLWAMGECLGWDVGALWRVDREAEALRCVELWHKASIEVPEFERVSREFIFVPGLGLPGRVWSSLEPEYIPDLVPDENFPRGPIAEREGLHAAFGFPILLGGEVLGVIEFFSREIRQPDQELLNMLATIGSQIGQFIERKRAEEALRESEYKLRQITDTVPGLLWSNGPDGEPTHISQRMLDYSGMRFEEFKHIGWEAFVHPADFPETAMAFDHAIQTGTSYQGVIRLRRADGEFRWHHARCEPLRDRQGRILQWYGLSVDIDEGKKTEEWPKFVAQLHDILNVIPAYTWYAAPSGGLTFMNKRTADYLGLPKDHALRFGIDVGAQWDAHLPFVHPDDRAETQENWSTRLRTGEGGEGSFRVLNAQGGYRWFLSRAEPLRANDGSILQWVGVNLDIEELKCAEQALRESEGKFRDYAETASDWFWEIGPDYKFTLLTENAFRSNSADRIGTLCWDHALDLETEPEKWRLVRATLDSRKPFRDFVYCSVDGSGSPMFVRASGKPMFDANGEFRGYRGTGTDVTALRTVEAEARENERRYRGVQLELAHANRVATMGQLSASITHEVNQPITAAVTYALAARRWLSADPPNFREADEALSLIVKEGNRAGEVVGRIRALIKKAPARKDAVAINDAILEVVALTRTEAANNSVSVRTQLAEGLPPVQGDRVQLQQVLLNLIINAIEAMRDVGEEERELLISTHNEPDGVSVEVRDSGPGFAPAALERVFEAFYTTKPSGLGLGLSICRSIIEAHNGQLWASPNVPRGAIFGFIAPAHPAAAS